MSLTPKEQKDIQNSFLETISVFKKILKADNILDLTKLEFDGAKITLKIEVQDQLIQHAQEVIPVKGIYPMLIGRFNFREKTSYIDWLKVGYFYDEMPASESTTDPAKENAMIKEVNQKLRNNYLGAFLVIFFINMSYKLEMEDVNLQDGTKKIKTTEGAKKNFYEKLGFIPEDDNDMTLTFKDIENIDEYFEKLKQNIDSHKNLIKYFQQLTTDRRRQTLRNKDKKEKDELKDARHQKAHTTLKERKRMVTETARKRGNGGKNKKLKIKKQNTKKSIKKINRLKLIK